MKTKQNYLKNNNIILTALIYIFVSAYSVAGESAPMPERGVCAHRGANTQCPENTVPAFEEAVRQGAAMIEFDVRFTKDRQMVILHDWTVDRTSNGHGKIDELTFEQVRALDFGAWKNEKFAGTKIPTLDETLAVMPEGTWLNVHLGGVPKEMEAELGLAVAAKIVETGRQRQAFIACSRRMAEAVKEKYPEILICNMERQGGNDPYIADTVARKCEFIQLAGKHPTPEQIKRLRDAGVKINYFGSNKPDEIKTLFELGVDFPLVDNLPLGRKVESELFSRPVEEHK